MSSLFSAWTWVALAGAVGTIAYLAPEWLSASRTTKLRGPPRDSWVFGQGKLLRSSKDAVAIVEEWGHTYGGAYSRPGAFGGQSVMITDAKAIAHFFANMETTYHLGGLFKTAIYNLVGKGVLWADGESHKRQRKSISPGFSNVKMREYTPIFFDAAYKLIAKWDDEFATQIEADGTFITDVQHWLNAVSLDSIGLAGFSHDFQALANGRGEVVQAFETLAEGSVNIFDGLAVLLGTTFPFLQHLPTPRHVAIARLNKACGILARDLLERSRQEIAGEKGDRSVMGLLIKAESAGGATDSAALQEELVAQMKTLMVAGYETTSSSLTWTLIELCRRLDIQQELRDELTKAFPSSDPTHEDINNQTTLPLLDAVVHEVLRLHPAVGETPRTAIKDDIIPLSAPITLPDGSSTDRIFIAKGQTVTVPLNAVNRARNFWGEDAKEFRPSRWLTSDLGKAQELSTYRHLMTFIDGPKTCLGKSFAVLEMKAVLAVLIRKYAFELLQGPETPIGKSVAIVLRPKVEGEKGARVPLRVRRLE